jgi:hypothetical protein
MADLRNVQRCRWAEPTLFADTPVWIAAEDFPWACYADGPPRPLEDTQQCSVCRRWSPRPSERLFACRCDFRSC